MSFGDPIVVIGHRGAAGLLPENTLPGFRRAYACGVSAVELDVYAVEGRLLVIHDDRLERTTNGTGSVMSQGVDALRTLDAGGGEPIPFLEEVIAELPASTGLNIELKGPATAELVAAFLDAHPDLDVLVSAFDHAELRRFHATAPRWPVAPLFHRWRRNAWEIAEDFSAWSINLNRRIVSETRLAAARGRGLRTLVYTVNDLAEAQRFIGWGASGVFTDYPDRITPEGLAGCDST